VVTGKFGFVNTTDDTMSAAASINDNLILESDPFTGCAVGGLAENCYNPPGPPHADTKDTVVEGHIKASKIPANSVLANSCSYPSAGTGGNNNPFDCIITPSTGFLVIKKDAGGDTSTSFGFQVGPPAPPVGTALFTVKGGSATGLINVLVGTNLKVAETTIPSGWQFSSATCKIGDIIDDPNGVNDPVTVDTTNNWITGVEI